MNRKKDIILQNLLMNVALEKQQAFLGVDTAGEKRREYLQRLLAQKRGIVADGQGMKIRDRVDALVFILKVYPIFYRAQIASDIQRSRRLYCAVNSLFFLIFHNINTYLS